MLHSSLSQRFHCAINSQMVLICRMSPWDDDIIHDVLAVGETCAAEWHHAWWLSSFQTHLRLDQRVSVSAVSIDYCWWFLWFRVVMPRRFSETQLMVSFRESQWCLRHFKDSCMIEEPHGNPDELRASAWHGFGPTLGGSTCLALRLPWL